MDEEPGELHAILNSNLGALGVLALVVLLVLGYYFPQTFPIYQWILE